MKHPSATGGQYIGPFTASVSFQNPMTWTNSNIKSITRANGQNITWTGGADSSYVSITGTSSSATATASFTCNVPAGPSQFTIPSYVLLALPPGANGNLQVANITSAPFSAPGLNSGSAQVGVSVLTYPTYQ